MLPKLSVCIFQKDASLIPKNTSQQLLLQRARGESMQCTAVQVRKMPESPS